MPCRRGFVSNDCLRMLCERSVQVCSKSILPARSSAGSLFLFMLMLQLLFMLPGSCATVGPYLCLFADLNWTSGCETSGFVGG
eukprot:1338560-Amphidinium_carterae.1